jgi:phosphonate transport system permease protein
MVAHRERGAVIIAMPLAGVDPGALLSPDSTDAASRFIAGLFPPELAPDYLARVLTLVVQTIAISIAGTVIAVVAAVPMGLLALRLRGEERSRAASGTGRWSARWAVCLAARLVLGLARAVPELAWALLFVVMVGLGPFAGVLALAAHSAGVLGKLYSELLESVDQRAVEAVRATGAREIAVTILVRVPLALPVLLSYTLFCWECNLRAATVLGLVGAGGIGTELILAFRLFRYHELLTLVLAVLALVVLIDVTGQVVRAQLLDAPPASACLPE